jgi:hypothetical protein
VSLATKPVGKPDAGNPHVRFDERGGETGPLVSASMQPRPSSTLKVQGASGLRINDKLFCDNDLRGFREAPRCERSLARNRAGLHLWRGSWPRESGEGIYATMRLAR